MKVSQPLLFDDFRRVFDGPKIIQALLMQVIAHDYRYISERESFNSIQILYWMVALLAQCFSSRGILVNI